MGDFKWGGNNFKWEVINFKWGSIKREFTRGQERELESSTEKANSIFESCLVLVNVP